MAETLYASASVSGGATAPGNATGTTDASFTTNIDNDSWSHTWDLDNPVGTLEATDVVEIALRVRKQDGTGNPTIDSVEILETATQRGITSTGWTVSSLTGEDINLTVSVTGMTNWNNARIALVTTAAGGSPPTRSAVQVDSMSVTVQNATTDRTAQIAWAEFETPDPPLPDFVRGWERTLQTVSQATITITKPTGVVSGDTMYAAIMHETGTGVTDTPPSGWTDIGTLPLDVGGGLAFVYKKTAGGSEPADYTFTFSVANQTVGYIVAVKDTYTEDALSLTAPADGDTDGDVDVTLSGISTSATDLLGIVFDDPTTPADPYFSNSTGMTKRDETADGYLGAIAAWFTDSLSSQTSSAETFGTGTDTGATIGVLLVSFIPSSTDRTAQLSWAELEVPTAPRTAQISWAELEIPTAPRTAQIAWAELEIPTAPRRARIAWAEMEMGDAPRRAQISWAEIELPEPPKRARISWAELELPDGARAAQVSWAELEIPTAPRRARISWAEFETTNPPRRARVSWTELEFGNPPRTAQIAWAELEIPTAPRRAQIAWTELELPTAPRRARLAWTELETPSVTRAVRLTWAELETPSAPRAARLAWTEMEIGNAPRNARVSWAELELPDGARAAQVAWAELELPDAPRRTRLAWAELELPSAPRRARIAWAELETPNQPNRKARLVWTEMQLPDAPGGDTRSGSTRLMLRGHS